MKYGKDNKTYLRRVFFYKELNYEGVYPDSYSNDDLYYVINGVNFLYRSRIEDLSDHKFEFEKMDDPNYKIIKQKK